MKDLLDDLRGHGIHPNTTGDAAPLDPPETAEIGEPNVLDRRYACLLYTSDAADE